MPITKSERILEQIGNVPLVRLQKLETKDSAAIYAKVEAFNPGGSVKDRICLAMIEKAEQDGCLKPGRIVIEPTSGNTGIGLSMVCSVKGYKLILTMPDTMTIERRRLLSAYGAELILTPGARGCGVRFSRPKNLPPCMVTFCPSSSIIRRIRRSIARLPDRRLLKR